MLTNYPVKNLICEHGMGERPAEVGALSRRGRGLRPVAPESVSISTETGGKRQLFAPLGGSQSRVLVAHFHNGLSDCRKSSPAVQLGTTRFPAILSGPVMSYRGPYRMWREVWRERRCYFALRNNFFVAEMQHGLPSDSEYRVFFDVRPTNDIDAVVLYFQSAYVGARSKRPAGRLTKKIGFSVLVGKALERRRPKLPP
jgi:hypothetical protein